jgi:hypothetical protein
MKARRKWPAVVAAIVGVPAVVYLLLYWIVHNRDPIALRPEHAAALAAGAGTLAILIGLWTLWKYLHRVELDEGGLRVHELGVRRYVPFSSIRRTRVTTTPLGLPRLELVTTSRVERLPLTRDAHGILDAVMSRTGPRAEKPVARFVRRRRRRLGEWVAALDAVRKGDAYRGVAIDEAATRALVASVDAAPDDRAGAAFLAARAGEAIEIDGRTPPIVVVMAAIGGASAGAGVLDVALRHLEDDDRADAARLLAEKRDTKRVRIAVDPGGEEEDEVQAEEEAARAAEQRKDA